MDLVEAAMTIDAGVEDAHMLGAGEEVSIRPPG